MTADEDARLIRAAETIREELPELVPDHADALGVELDVQFVEFKAAPTAKRPVTADAIVELLTKHEATRERLGELLPADDVERGLPADFWAPDGTLAGTPVRVSNLVEITCKTCGYVNKRKYYPPMDDSGDCQNPEPPVHELKLA